MHLFAYYRSVGGTLIPTTYRYDGRRSRAVRRFRAIFDGSVTPLAQILPPVNPDALAAIYGAQLTATPLRETGLRHALECCINDATEVMMDPYFTLLLEWCRQLQEALPYLYLAMIATLTRR